MISSQTLWFPVGALRSIAAITACSVIFTLSVLIGGAQGNAIDWAQVAELKPRLKILVVVRVPSSFTISDLALLADKGLVPADRDPGLVTGLKEAVFSTRLGKWMQHNRLPDRYDARILSRFIMTGVYRVSFQVVEPGYVGPLSISVTAPRDGFGRELLSSDYVVRPNGGDDRLRKDSAGNRWLSVTYPEMRTGQNIKFHFGFTYLVDVRELLERDLELSESEVGTKIPDVARSFLKPGYKIDTSLPQAMRWAAAQVRNAPDARRKYSDLARYLNDRVTYDNRKRAQYFGGRSIYSDVDEMYQDPKLTLARGAGCCPDTTLVECSFLRAAGVPCRPAGRFGHFFSHVYVPGRGWMSTSVTPTGIPLLEAVGPDHLPYQWWKPRIQLKTTKWEARTRIEPAAEGARMVPAQETSRREPAEGPGGFSSLFRRGILGPLPLKSVHVESDAHAKKNGQ